MDSAFTDGIFGEIMSTDPLVLSHVDARKGLDRCAQYLNIAYRVLDSQSRQLACNPCPLMCDKIEAINEKVTAVSAMQQELFTAYLKGWDDDSTIEIMMAENVDLAASKASTQATQQSWYQKAMKMTTDSAKAVKNAWQSLGPSTARDSRWRRRQSRSPDRGGRHTSDPPDRAEQKIALATELKPEMLSTDTDQLHMIAWKEQSIVFMTASKLDKQAKETQLAYLRTLCTPEMWQEVMVTAEYSNVDMKELNFMTGLDLVENTFLKMNNQYLLQLKTLSSKFKGSTAKEFLTWFYTFKQQAVACRVFNLSLRQLMCLWALKELPQSIQTKVLETNNKPELDELIRIVENIATVETMQERRKGSTVNNINDITDERKNKQVKCYRCSGAHYRSQCSVPSVWCSTCSTNNHSNEACGLDSRDRRARHSQTPERTSYSSRSQSRTSTEREGRTSASSSSSSSSSEDEDEKRRKKKKEKKRRARSEERKERKKKEKKSEKKDKKSDRKDKKSEEKGEGKKPRMRRNSSSTTAASSRASSAKSRSRSRSTSRGRQPNNSSGKGANTKRKKTPMAPKRKRGTINAVEGRVRPMTAKREVLCVVKDSSSNSYEEVQVIKESPVKAVLDTGCDYYLVQNEVCKVNGWIPKQLRPSQKPNLTNPDGSPLAVSGYVNIWVRLPSEPKSRKLRCFVVDNLMNKMLIGLPALKRLRWIPKNWPACIGEEAWRMISSSDDESEGEETDEEGIHLSQSVNAVGESSEWQKEESRRRRWEDKRKRSRNKAANAPLVDQENDVEKESIPGLTDTEPESSDEESIPGLEEARGEDGEEMPYLNALLERTDYKQIPSFDTLPAELQQAILDYRGQFSNTMKRGDAMKVKPAKFKLKKNYKVPEQRGGVQLPPIHMREACDKLLDELEEAGVIEPSPPDDSEFTSRAIFIAKKNDPTKIRLCIDYLRSGANQALVRTPHPQPTPDQLVSNIPPGMKYMAVMDVKHCYYMHPLERDENCGEGEVGRSISKFCTYRGSHRLTSLPQGLKNSSDWISHTLGALQQEKELKMTRSEGGLERCVDDMLLVAIDFPTFMRKFRMLMSKCEQYGVYLNPQKFCYSTDSVKFGGCIVSRHGVSQDPERLRAIKEYLRPQSASDVRRFLGLCTSLSRYTNTLLRSTTHLRSLTVAHAPFVWTDQHQKEFDFLREDLSQPRLLHHFRPGLQIGGDVDASDNGWGGMIYAYDRTVSEEPQEGNFFLLGAYSAAAPPSWRNFSTTEKEACASLQMLRKAAFYTAGTTIRLRNDHKPWIQAFNGQDLLQCPNRLKRIMIEMRDHSVEMVYAPQIQLQMADAFSRAPLPEVAGDDPLDQLHQQRIKHGYKTNNVVNNVIDQDDVLYNINDILYADIFHHAQDDALYQQAVEEARKDNTNKNWKDLPKGCFARSLQDNWAQTSVVTNDRGQSILVINGERLVCPQSYVPKVMEMVDVAHVGSKKAIALCRNKFYWKGYQEDIIRHCQSCHTCRMHQQNFPEEPEAPALEGQLPTRPFQMISADEFQCGDEHLLMICDRFSGFSRVCKFGPRRTSVKIIEMLKGWCMDYSWPEVFLSDGPNVLISQEMKDWLRDNKIQHRVSSPGRPRSNGAIESRLKCYKAIRDKLVTEGRYSAGAMQEAWSTAQDFPAEPGELPPSRLALLQDRRNPRLPFLPGEPGEEIDVGQQARQVRERRKMERNEKMAKNVRKPPELALGLRVLVQNKKGVFCIPAKIIAIRPESHNRTAVVEYMDGSTQIRNRRFFIEDKSQPQVNDVVANVEDNKDFYFRLQRSSKNQEGENGQYDMDGEGEYEVKEVLLSNRLKSCMKAVKTERGERKCVRFADSAREQQRT